MSYALYDSALQAGLQSADDYIQVPESFSLGSHSSCKGKMSSAPEVCGEDPEYPCFQDPVQARDYV